MEGIHYGIDRAKLDKILLDLGGSVTPVRRTGEIRYRHRLVQKSVRADSRRKDAPMRLVKFVLEVIDARRRLAANDDSYFSGSAPNGDRTKGRSA